MTATADTTSPAVARSPHALIGVRLEQLFQQPWFYYGTILLLQLHRIWGMWQYRDMTDGDTSSYFVDAWRWFHSGRTNIAWSPLYDCFYGTLLFLSRDAATVTVLHRILIVFAATILVVAVARRMLPAELAWLVGAWWAVLPINFDAMYEVHLFALLPILAAWLVIMWGRGPWSRGIALAIFFLSTILVRNEMSIGTLCLAAVCVGWEIRERRRARRTGAAVPPAGPTLLAYLLPGLAAVAVILAVYARSIVKFPELSAVLEGKHTNNMAQVYAVGYAQRHPEYTKNPWTEYQGLLTRDFGVALPSFWQMVRRNPRAVAEHVLWNYRLLPNGLQMMLFSATSGSLDPDYAGIHLNERYPRVLGIIALAIAAIGTLFLAIDWRRRWRAWFASRMLCWLALLCVIGVAAAVIATQRPRPEYLFSLTFILMIYLAICIYAIAVRLPGIGRLRPLMPFVMVALALGVPSAYGGKVHPPQPMLETYERLRPYERLFYNPNSVFLSGDYPEELTNYLGFRRGRCMDDSILHELKPGETLAEVLDAHHVNLLYLGYRDWVDLESRVPGIVEQFVKSGRDEGWEMVAYGTSPLEPRWMLCRRVKPGTSPGTGGLIPSLPGTGEFSGWAGLESLAAMEGPYPAQHLPAVRWGLGPETTLLIQARHAGHFTFLMSGRPGLPEQEITVSLDGKPLGTFPLTLDQFNHVSLPLSLEAGQHKLVLRYNKCVQASPTVCMAVLFEQLKLQEDTAGEPPAPTSRPHQ
jgi:hypothetical protein